MRINHETGQAECEDYHNFEPRYDVIWMNCSSSLHTSDEEFHSDKIYLYDICKKCGKIIKRKRNDENSSQA